VLRESKRPRVLIRLLETAAGGDGVQDSPVSGVEQKEGSVGWWEAILLGVATPECCLFAQTSRSVLFEAVHPRQSALAAGAIGTPRNQRLASAKQSEGQSILWSSLIIAVLFYCMSLYLQDVPYDMRPPASSRGSNATLHVEVFLYEVFLYKVLYNRPANETRRGYKRDVRPCRNGSRIGAFVPEAAVQYQIRYNLSCKRSFAFAG
jgi:hypothetical protein